MPLRPVSELGLVDITDVPARDGKGAATPRHSTRARRNPSRPLSRDSANDHQRQTRGDRSKGARRATHAKPAAGRTGSKTFAGTPRTAAPAPAPAKRPNTNTKPLRANASTATSSERPRSRAKAATETRSGATPRSATTRSTPKRATRSASAQRRATTVRRQTSAGTRPKRNDASREAQGLRKGRAPRRTKSPSAAKVSISVLMGASLVAGILFARAALQR